MIMVANALRKLIEERVLSDGIGDTINFLLDNGLEKSDLINLGFCQEDLDVVCIK